MRRFIVFSLVTAAAIVSASFVVVDHASKDAQRPSIDPFALTLQAGDLPVLELKDLV